MGTLTSFLQDLVPHVECQPNLQQSLLPDHSTAVSLLDRLLHHNNVVATDGESYCMREARSRPGGRPSSR